MREETCVANGLCFALLEAGPADGTLALCLHGFPDSAWTWRHLLPALGEAGYRAVAPWLRGYAPTQVPPDGGYQTALLGLDRRLRRRAGPVGDDRGGRRPGPLAAVGDAGGATARGHRRRVLRLRPVAAVVVHVLLPASPGRGRGW